MATVISHLPAVDGAPAPSSPRTWWRRVVLGPAAAPRWARPALLGLLAVTAVLYLWDLSASGWANSFYAAAVEAASKSWKATFFGSFDSSNFITVDKPPAALWVMDLSVRLFGVNSWSLLAPQALEGVATVGVVYAATRRWFGHLAGLVAGAVIALTPAAALMFRYDNPDALLTLLLATGTYCIVRAVEDGRTRWVILAGALVGTGFLTKMLEATLIVPALGLVVLVATPGSLRRRVGQLAAGAVALAVSALWWVAAVMAVPAADRPYVGGSSDDSLWNLIFGYNGFGRLDGREAGSVGGGGGSGGMWGPTGITRLFNSQFGGGISWLLPAALVLVAVGAVVSWRSARSDRTRAATILWGGWLLVTGLTLSLSKGIIHPYYTIVLAPAVGAIVGIGVARLWSERGRTAARAVAAGGLASTAVWAWVLLDRSPSWYPWLRWGVLIGGLAVAVAIVAGPYLAGALGRSRRGGAWLASLALVVALAGPAAYTADTVTTPHTGAIPSVGPTLTGAFGGGAGAGARGGFAGGRPGRFAGLPGSGNAPTGSAPGRVGGRASKGRGRPAGGRGLVNRAGRRGRSVVGRGGRAALPSGRGRSGAGVPTGRGGSAQGVGGLLNGATVDAALRDALERDARRYTWVAAVVGAEDASTYQLATFDPVMAIGGFNGTDPAPTLADFERDVREHKIHYFIGGASGLGGSGSGDAGEITAWVESHFRAETIGGTTVYDLGAGVTR